MPPVRPAARRTQGSVGGQTVSWLERPGADPPVVLIHGWGASSLTFTPLLQGSRTERRLLAPDLPGFGESPVGPGGWTTSSYRELLGGWLERTGAGAYSLLGHSYGGAVAVRLAAGGPAPDRLLLCAPSGVRPGAGGPPPPRVRVFRALRALGRPLPQAAGERWRDWLGSRFGSPDYRGAAPALRPTLVAAVREDLTPVVGSLRLPTLIVWGSRDPELPLDPHGERLHRLLRGSELVVFEGSGHFPFLDQAARFAAVFDALMDAGA